jgi:CDGSH-type Zn-finger protein
MFKSNEWVMILNQQIPAQIDNIEGSTVELKLQDGKTIITNIDNIKKKKNCSCNKSKKYPFCDGSHAS